MRDETGLDTRTVWVSVTQEDIDYCKRNFETDLQCPVARAVDRRLQEAWKSLVSPYECTIHYRYSMNVCTRAEVPYEVSEFITDFDTDEAPKPFRFRIDLPIALLK